MPLLWTFDLLCYTYTNDSDFARSARPVKQDPKTTSEAFRLQEV